MIEDPPFAVEDVAQQFADASIFAQRLAVGLADKRKARDRRFGSSDPTLTTTASSAWAKS